LHNLIPLRNIAARINKQSSLAQLVRAHDC
jgi:hypothetical protein